jgi:hypothetical protein
VETRTLPGWIGTANRVVKALQRLGLPLGTIHVLTVPGRVSGAPRATPVRAVVRAFPTEVPHGVEFFVRLGLVERADPEQFAAASDRVAVFEVREPPTPR